MVVETEKIELKLYMLGLFTYGLLDIITFIMCYLISGSAADESSFIIQSYVSRFGLPGILMLKLMILTLAFFIIDSLKSQKQRIIMYTIVVLFGCIGTIANIYYLVQVFTFAS